MAVNLFVKIYSCRKVLIFAMPSSSYGMNVIASEEVTYSSKTDASGPWRTRSAAA
jgi:hypothetical protein